MTDKPKQPLTLEVIENFLSIQTPDNKARAGWSIRSLELIRAKKEIGIELPVRIRYSAGIYRYGTHYLRRADDGTYYHRIVLNHKRKALEANETLLHELAHAFQAESFAKITGNPPIDFYDKAYKLQGYNGKAYKNNPFEVQAREFAAANKTVYVIIKEGG